MLLFDAFDKKKKIHNAESNIIFLFFLIIFPTLEYSVFQPIVCAIFCMNHSADGFKQFTYPFRFLAVPFCIFKGHSIKKKSDLSPKVKGVLSIMFWVVNPEQGSGTIHNSWLFVMLMQKWTDILLQVQQ